MRPDDDLDRAVGAVRAALAQQWPGTEFYVGIDLLNLTVLWVANDTSPAQDDVRTLVAAALAAVSMETFVFVTPDVRGYPPLLAEAVAVVRSWMAGDLELNAPTSPMYGHINNRDEFDAYSVVLADVDDSDRSLAEALIAHTGLTPSSHLGYLGAGTYVVMRRVLGVTMLECGEAFVDAMTPVPV
jgi:hypothetical protein